MEHVIVPETALLHSEKPRSESSLKYLLLGLFATLLTGACTYLVIYHFYNAPSTDTVFTNLASKYEAILDLGSLENGILEYQPIAEENVTNSQAADVFAYYANQSKSQQTHILGNQGVTEKYVSLDIKLGGIERNQAITDFLLRDDYSINGIVPVPVHDFYQTQYYIEIMIGTTGQIFTVLPDTGSGLVWVPSSHCNFSCFLYSRYRDGKSSNYVSDGTQCNAVYGSGSISGYYSYDSFTVGNVVVPKFRFAEAIKRNMAHTRFDGILGFSLEKASVDNNPLFLYVMKNNSVIENAMVSFYFGRSVDEMGNMVIGGYNPTYFTGDILFFKSISDAYWMVETDSMGFGTSQVITGAHAIFDSGTSIIAGPKSAIDKMIATLPVHTIVAPGVNLRLFDYEEFSKLPDFVVNIAGKPFNVTPKMYTLCINQPINAEKNKRYCALLFVGLDFLEKYNMFILGDPFLREYYSIFDLDTRSIGLAKSI